MDLFLVRHGEMGMTSTNDFLTARGGQQARQTGRYFARLPVTALISSPLVRALGTAQLMAQEMGLDAFEVWPDLREGLFEELQGYGTRELSIRYPLARFPETMADDACFYPADTQASMLKRSQEFLDMIMVRFQPNDTVVVVAHGGIISYLFHVLLQVSPQAFSFFAVKYASISHIYLVPDNRQESALPVYPDSRIDVMTVGDTSHLTEEI